MSQNLQVSDPLASLSLRARRQLANISHTPFSEEGFNALQDEVEEYIADLTLESVRIMERRQADTISRKYVQQASENLVASTRRRLFTLVGTVGGILLGASVSSYFEIIRRGATTVPETLVATTFAVVGVFMIALQFAKE
jgi:hypothetical protein